MVTLDIDVLNKTMADILKDVKEKNFTLFKNNGPKVDI